MSLLTESGQDNAPLIGALLRIPWESVQEGLLTGLHERGFNDLRASHLSVLVYPGPDGLRPSELAAQRRISKQAANYLLGELERLGYLQRLEDPADQRQRRIALTSRGQQAGRAMRDIVRAVERDWETRLGPERYTELRNLLTDLNTLAATETTTAANTHPA